MVLAITYKSPRLTFSEASRLGREPLIDDGSWTSFIRLDSFVDRHERRRPMDGVAFAGDTLGAAFFERPAGSAAQTSSFRFVFCFPSSERDDQEVGLCNYSALHWCQLSAVTQTRKTKARVVSRWIRRGLPINSGLGFPPSSLTCRVHFRQGAHSSPQLARHSGAEPATTTCTLRYGEYQNQIETRRAGVKKNAFFSRALYGKEINGDTSGEPVRDADSPCRSCSLA